MTQGRGGTNRENIGRGLVETGTSSLHHRMMSERANRLLADVPRGDRSKGTAARRNERCVDRRKIARRGLSEYMCTSDMSIGLKAVTSSKRLFEMVIHRRLSHLNVPKPTMSILSSLQSGTNPTEDPSFCTGNLSGISTQHVTSSTKEQCKDDKINGGLPVPGD
jgi:hypothetical protein